VEWLRFLKQLDRNTPRDLDFDLIVDNYATHKHAEVKAWLARRPRFHIHFTPTGSSWLNLVERFFADLTQDAIMIIASGLRRDPSILERWSFKTTKPKYARSSPDGH
jgi:transposase